MGTRRPPMILTLEQAIRHKVWAFEVSCVFCGRAREIPVLVAYRWLGPGASLKDLSARFHCGRHAVFGDRSLGIDVRVVWPRARYWRDRRRMCRGAGRRRALPLGNKPPAMIDR